jgi:hypothetical protein
MMPFSAPAAAALKISPSSIATGVYAYHAVIRFDLATNARNAPQLVSLILAKIQLDEPNCVFTNGDAKCIDNGDLPEKKLTFDNTFTVTTNRTSLYCHFVINSSRTFHQVKIGAWALLQQHCIYLDKTPGPISRTDLVPMGFWMHVHPGFASTRSFQNQLSKKNIADRYDSSPVVAELNLPTEFAEPDVYFTSSKCKGTYGHQPLQTNTLCMYGSRTDFDRIATLVTHISSFATTVDNKTPMYVPFALKQSHPEIYGQYLAQQNAFLESHRNIAIVGVHPEAMDYGDDANPDPNFPNSLWNTISQMPGVYHVDSCRRTHDLGKWNISYHSAHHQAIATWIDTNLSEIWSQVPLDLPIYDAFSAPERLSGNRVSRSVASGLTDASLVSHYLQSLAARHQTSTKLTTVVRNPWRQTLPFQSVVYQFDKTEYPLPGGDATATARTTDSTMLDTYVITASAGSTRYDASVQLSVDRQLESYQAARATKDANFTSRMNAMEVKIQGIQDQLSAIAASVTEKVLAGLQKSDGLLAQQDTKIDLLSAKLLKLFPMVKQILGPNGTHPLSPTRAGDDSPGKKQKLDGSTPMSGVQAS